MILESLKQRQAMLVLVNNFKELTKTPKHVYPIDVIAILKQLDGILIVQDDPCGTQLELVDDNKLLITINKDTYQDKERLRQALALQFGHYALHLIANIHNDKQTKKYILPKRKAWKAETQEAELFANQLLMPSEDFCNEIDKNIENGMVNLNSVASKFGTNLHYTKRWAEELGAVQWRP